MVRLLSFPENCEASKLSGSEMFNDFFFVNYEKNKYKMLNSWSFFDTKKNPSWMFGLNIENYVAVYVAKTLC